MAIQYKKFVDYAAYVKKQGGKISFKLESILAQCEARTKGFKKIFTEYQHDLVPGKVLCLGARTGCEVVAARTTGFKGVNRNRSSSSWRFGCSRGLARNPFPG